MITKKTLTLRRGLYDNQLVVYVDERKYVPTVSSVVRLMRLVDGKTTDDIDFGVGGILVRYEVEQDKTVQKMLHQPIAKAELRDICELHNSDGFALLHFRVNNSVVEGNYAVELARVKGIKQEPDSFTAYTLPATFEWSFNTFDTVADAIKQIQKTLTHWDGYITAYHWVAQEIEKKL